MSQVPPREPFAAACRKAVSDHDTWDSPHQFVTFSWDGTGLRPNTVAMIMPDVHPDDYPAMLRKVVAEENAEPGPRAYAFLLQVEAHGVGEPPEDDDAEQAIFHVARRTRTFHRLPQAREICVAYMADVHGRVWTAAKERGREDEPVSESFYGVLAADRPGGQFIRALVSIGYAQGAAHFGLPVPGGLLT